MNEATFRANFPEFGDVGQYSSQQVTFWLGIAAQRVNADAWGNLTDLGLALFTAHNLVMARRRAKVAGLGGVPGATQGVISADAIEKVSTSYDTGATTIDGAGNWNATDYGVQFWQYAQLMGAGGAQL